MSASQIIKELASKPLSVIEADLRRVEAERTRLQTEESFLRAVRELVKNEQESHAPSAPVETSQVPQSHGDARPDGGTASDGSDDAKKVLVRDVILEVMRRRGFEPWPIPRVIEAVQERKSDAQAPAIRMALRRLYDQGELMKDQNNHYRLNPEKHSNVMLSGFSIGQRTDQGP